MKAYYQDNWVTIFNADCRDVLPILEAGSVLVTDPPYPNNAGWFDSAVSVAREVLAGWQGYEALAFWTELEQPPIALPLVAVHIWHRSNVNGRPYEPIYHYTENGEKRRSCVRSLPAVFDGAGPGCMEYLGHPTQKSVCGMRWLIGMLKAPGILVDPFMGVGTTLVAAREMGRRAIGIEIEERYCEIAARRMAQAPMVFEDVPEPEQLPLEVGG